MPKVAGRGSGKGASGKAIKVRMPDEGAMQEMRTILTYESTVRGRRLGQTLCEMVLEAADVESYPPEVRARLAEIEEAMARESLERFLSGAAED